MLQSGVGGSLGSQAGRLANTRSYDADKLMYETLGKLTHSSPLPLPPPSERLFFHRTIIKTLQSQPSVNPPFYQSAVLINTLPALLAPSVQINQQQQTHSFLTGMLG